MNILYITSEMIYPAHTGGKKSMLDRLKWLSRNDDVTLISFYTDEISEADENYLKKYAKNTFFIKKKSFFSSFFHALFLPYPLACRYDRNIVKTIREIYMENNIQKIVLEQPQLWHLIKSFNCNVTIDSHNVEYLTMRSICKSFNNPIKKAIYFIESYKLYFYEKKVYKVSKNNTSYSFVSKDDMKFYMEKFSSIKNNKVMYIPPTYIKSPESTQPSKNSVGFFGNMSYGPNNYGAEWIISKVFPLVQAKCDDFKLYIVGKGPSSELLNCSSEKIIVTGEVADMDEYYDKVDIVLIPIFHGGGIKMKLIEAAAHGKMIISTPFGLIGSEFTGESVLIGENAEQFADYILQLFNNPIKYQNTKNKMKEVFDLCYDLNNISARYIEFIKDGVSN